MDQPCFWLSFYRCGIIRLSFLFKHDEMKYAFLGNAFFRIGVRSKRAISKIFVGGSCGLDEQQASSLSDVFSLARLRQLLQKDYLARIGFCLNYEIF